MAWPRDEPAQAERCPGQCFSWDAEEEGRHRVYPQGPGDDEDVRPVIHADLTLEETYKPPKQGEVAAFPITAIAGKKPGRDQEKSLIKKEDAELWAGDLRALQGGDRRYGLVRAAGGERSEGGARGGEGLYGGGARAGGRIVEYDSEVYTPGTADLAAVSVRLSCGFAFV